MNIVPTLVDLQHFAYWFAVVAVVAVALWLAVVLIERAVWLGSVHGTNDLPTLRILIPTRRQRKNVVDLDARRRELELLASYPPERRRP